MQATSASTAAPGRKLRADAQRNYDKLVAVARQAFSEHGADASLDDIAKRAGVGPGTLYRHFPTRSDLHLAVLQDWQAEVRAEGERLAAIDDPAQVLDEWLHRYIAYKSVFRGLHEALLESAEGDDDRTALGLCKQLLTGISRDVIDRAKAAGLVRQDVEAATVCQMLSGIVFLLDRNPAGGVDVETQIGIIKAGIRPAA